MKKVLYIVGALIALALISRFILKPNASKSTEALTESKIIPGANPVDIYLNLKNKGFKIDKQLGSGSCSWMCTKSESGISYLVNIASKNPNTIQQVAITANLDGTAPGKKIVAVKPFIKWASSFPYEGQDIQKLASWIESNFDKNGASTIIGTVKVTMSAPNKSTRQLNILKS